jgi:hypothetical protein
MGGIVALAAATINSSLANLIPVKITVQSDAGLITSFENLDKSKSSEASNEAVRTECQVQEKKATADEAVAAATSISSSVVVAGSRGSGGSGGSGGNGGNVPPKPATIHTKCHKCRGYGHYAADCASKQRYVPKDK